MSQGCQDCCLCKDAITTTVKYTECCTEPICDHCQADLLTSKIVSCLACNCTINPCSLVEPLTLLQQHFDQILKDTLDRLTNPIEVFTKAIADLTSQLNRHYDDIARLRQIMLKDNPSQLVVLDQEYIRVIKPLQTTIQANLDTLSELAQLRKQLLGLTTGSAAGQTAGPDLANQQGRLLHLSQRIKSRVEYSQWTEPNMLWLEPLWYCRHPLGSKLVSTNLIDAVNLGRYVENTNVAVSTTILGLYDVLRDQFEAEGKHYVWTWDLVVKVSYQELKPGYFVIMVAIMGQWVWLLNEQGQILITLGPVVVDSVKIGPDYLVYLVTPVAPVAPVASSQVRVYKHGLGSDSGLIPLSNPGKDYGITIDKIVSLEADQLWVYQTELQELQCYYLADTQVNTESVTQPHQRLKIPALELLSYHRGIYCTRQLSTDQPARGLLAGTVEPEYYQVCSVYSEHVFESACHSPVIYCDGSMICYEIDRYILCHNNGDANDLTDYQGFRRFTRAIHDEANSQITSDGNLMTWHFDQEYQLIIRKYSQVDNLRRVSVQDLG